MRRCALNVRRRRLEQKIEDEARVEFYCVAKDSLDRTDDFVEIIHSDSAGRCAAAADACR